MKPRDPTPKNAIGALLTLAGGLFAASFCAKTGLEALSTGQSIGRMGAIHHAPSLEYYAGVGGCLIGVALGLGLAWMSWRWIKNGPPEQ